MISIRSHTLTIDFFKVSLTLTEIMTDETDTKGETNHLSRFNGEPNPMQPISLEKNEELKKLKKQERNRAAAKRCRDRKNEKLNFLEGEVSTLKEKKARLIDEQNNLKSELQSLQQRYNSHVGSNQPECAYNSPLPVCDFKQL